MELKQDSRFQDPAYFDALTGIYNRYFLYQAIPEIIHKIEASHSNLGILMLDLDNFKNINDSHGHLAGDKALKEVSKILENCVRGDDLVIRYAGDEFIVLLRGRGGAYVSPDTFEAAGRRIIEEISKAVIKIDDAQVLVTFSAGLAVYPEHGKELEELIDSADKALYLAKEKGKNRLSLSQEVTQETSSKKEALRLFPCKKFIDRNTELANLNRILQDSRTGKTLFVLVKGKTGLGKSRLLSEFKNSVDSQQLFSLEVEASSKHTLQPYFIFSQALNIFLEKNNSLLKALASSLSQEEIMALATLVPVFKDSIKDSVQKIIPNQGQFIFKALRNIFVELSSSQGLFLFFNNIHWLDKATFELINYLLNFEFVRKILICATLDNDELEEDATCNEFLASAKNKNNFSVIELSPFSLKETKELISNIFPQISAAEELNKYIYEITEGSPLFIEEMLKYLVESGIIFYKDNLWQLQSLNKEDIPSSLEDVLERRFRKLDPETKEVLAKAAVIGEDFESEVLRQAIKKDQGYIFELLDRAKKKNFVGSKEKIDKFNFVPPAFQKLIYGQIEAPERIRLHQDFAGALEEIYKDRPHEILGDLAYHYEKMGDSSKLAEYKNKILKESLELFNPAELGSYLEGQENEPAGMEIPSEVRIQKTDTQASDKLLEKSIDLIKYIFAAIKNIGLYPISNKIREVSADKVYDALKDALAGLSSVTFSEVEKILLINNKRIPYLLERSPVVEDLVSLMIDRDIKGIQFLSTLDKNELAIFLEICSQNPQDLRGGLIAQKVKEKGLKNIKLDTASFQRNITQERFKPIMERVNKVMLMDFLSGKGKPQGQALETFLKAIRQDTQGLAQDLLELARSRMPAGPIGSNPKEEARIVSESIHKIANELIPQGTTEFQENLRRLILSLDNKIKPYLFCQEDKALYEDTVKILSDEEVVDVIMSARSLPEKENLVYMRELFNRFTTSSGRKEKIVPILKEKLEKAGLGKSESTFVMGKQYEDLGLEERMETMLKLPPQAYSTLGEQNIENVIKELINNSDKENLEVLIRHFLSELESGDSKNKEGILKLIGVFFSFLTYDSSEFDSIAAETISVLNNEIPNIDSAAYPVFLRGLESAIEWSYKGAFSSLTRNRWIMRSRFELIDKILNSLYEMLNTKDELPEIQLKKARINESISSLLDSNLIDALALELKDPFLDYNKVINNEIVRFGRGCLKRFLFKVLESRDFSGEGYMYHRKIAVLLKEMGKDAESEIKAYLSSENSPQKLRQLIEIIGFMQGEDCVEALKTFANYKDYEVREAVIFALGNIGSALAKQILNDMAKDRDLRIARLAKREIKV